MSFRQVDQRHVSSEICLMEWSPTMDLIALVTVSGEVLLHRLSWQKVWSLPSRSRKEKDVNVTALAWRPDGKVLAIAYDSMGQVKSTQLFSGNIFLVDIENSETIHLLDISGTVTCLKWVENLSNEAKMSSFYNDNSPLFLPKYYSLVKSYSYLSKSTDDNLEDAKRVKEQDNINMLLVGTDAGSVHLYAFGMFHCGHVDVQTEELAHKILSVSLSEDFSLLTVFLEVTEKDDILYQYKSYNLPLLKSKIEEFRVVAWKYGQVASLLTFLSATIRSITEAWEDILLEFDSKLTRYAMEKKNVPGSGSIGDDFLELLMFGTPSDALDKFLFHDLTENGLKKFGHSIELSYSNIQKLVLKKLQNVASSLYFNLTDLKGISLWEERFGELGFHIDTVKPALSAVGSFLMKATEIQQVIDSSMKNFKAFFRWLYSVILRFSDEHIPAEITKVTQQDLNFVAEFLKENFTDESELNRKTSFRLERVGQYLKNENLPFPPSVENNPWVSFLEKNPQLKGNDLLFPYHPELSLVQQHQEVRKTIEVAFSGPKNVFHKTVTAQNRFLLFKRKETFSIKICQTMNTKDGYCISMFNTEPLPVEKIYFLAESITNPNDIKCLSLSFGELPDSPIGTGPGVNLVEKCTSYKILDAKFYNDNLISILLSEDHASPTRIECAVLLQLQLKSLCRDLMMPLMPGTKDNICIQVPKIDGGKYVDKSGHKRLENCKVIELAVSGSRKVACVLFSSRRQVRLFEMEVEEEEEDPQQQQPQECSIDQDESMKEDQDDPFTCSANFAATKNTENITS